MKRALIFLLLLAFVLTAVAQPKTRGRVKRKYRNVEQVNENLPQVIFRGLVRDIYKNPIPGAIVEIPGINRLVHSNEYGQFMLTDLPTGRLRLKFACIGYRTKTIDYVLQEGYNDHYVALDQEPVHLEALISTSQKREQQLPDVPASVSVITKSFAGKHHLTGFQDIAEYNPVFGYEELGAGKAGFYLQGNNGLAGFSHVSPSVAVYSDEVPLMVPAAVSPMFFDFERVEIMNGSQNSLFGRHAIGGAVHLISKKPVDSFEGYMSAGGGSFGTKEARAAVNVPVINKLLFVRAAGVFSANNGYVGNSAGGTLNGTGRYGGRFSLRFIPAYNHKLDVTLSYIQNKNSGVAFMNPWFHMSEENSDGSDYQASLTRGNELGSALDLMNGKLTYRYFRNEHNFLTIISSFSKSFASDVWDADGTILPALEMEDEQNTEQLYQELRYNFTRKSRLSGSAGLTFSSEKDFRWHGISSNDQLIFDILKSPGNNTMPANSRFPVHPQPLNPNPLGGFTFTGLHHEENIHERLTQSAQAYLQFSYRLNQVLFFTGGVRAFYDQMKLDYESLFTGGAESSLGQFSNSSPGLFHSPSGKQQMSESFLSVAGEAMVTYRWNENFNFFVKAARGRKPQVLLFSWDSQPLVLDPEMVNSAEAGMKMIIKQRVYWNAAGFYRRHSNVHTIPWGNSVNNGLLAAHGKATSYGAETGLKAAVIKGLDVFGNYAWMHSAFDSLGVDGSAFLYAENSFAHSPKHSFSAGLTAKARLIKGMHLFATSWYSWKSQFWFTEANSSALLQNAYGLLNARAGIELDAPRVILSIHGKNLLEERYLSSAGNWGALFGIPTAVPGAPRMMGAKMTWSF
ncbi:MAG: TonB-dependent receptor [Mariniphaga sp.]